MRITVLGLGRMGSAIASRLLDRGYTLTVWNRSAGKAGDLIQRGAHDAGSIAEAVREADVVITSLSDDAAVQQTYLGPDGVLSAARADATMVDMSTVAPETAQALARAAGVARVIDSPILAGPEVAAQGKGYLLLGGNRETVTRLEALWNDLSQAHLYCGTNGQGNAMKLLCNLILVSEVTVMAEAVATAQAAGIEDDVVRQVLGQSPLLGPGVRNRLEDVIAGDHRLWFTVTLAQKDVQLAGNLAERVGTKLFTGPAAAQALARAEQLGYGQLDLAAVVEAVRGKAAGER